jgi:hypothetical protein
MVFSLAPALFETLEINLFRFILGKFFAVGNADAISQGVNIEIGVF